MNRPRRNPPPLDAAALDRLALRYVERYATTRGKLATYLARKVRERGWAEDAPADPPAVAGRMAALGYVDDRGFAEMRAAAMTRRGLGARRIAGALRQAGVGETDAETLAPTLAENALSSALAFARRKRIGPFAAATPDRAGRDKALGAMLRAGHGIDIARRIISLPPSEDPDLTLFPDHER